MSASTLVSPLKDSTALNNIQKRQGRLILLLLIAIPVIYLAIFIIQQIIWMLGMIFLLLLFGWFVLNFKRR